MDRKNTSAPPGAQINHADRAQDARDYAEAEARRQAQSNRDDANLRGPQAGGRR